MHLNGVLCILLAGFTADGGQVGSGARIAGRDLTSLSIEELMRVEVTSVSKKEEKLSEAPSAVYVITQEDIRRSGLKQLPEVLRLAPGLQVARIDANKWAISARGFNGRFANKLLVLIDGRSVYTPLFSGVYWDVQDVMLEDVERIEVIRGPGATMWGANAVNGVVNIITKKPRDTQGGLVTAGGGSEDLGFGAARYGGKLGDSAHYRAYVKYQNHDDFVDASGDDASDEWSQVRGGFRLDWDLSPNDVVTAQGDVYGGQMGSRSTVVTFAAPAGGTFNDEVDVYGGNILGRWTHVISEASNTVLQLYYDRADRNDPLLAQRHDVFDVDFQHRFRPWARHDILWGFGYRAVLDRLDDGPSVSMDPHSRDAHLVSGFLQDEIALVRDRLRFILGSKIEYNDFTEFEYQPNGRLLWTPDERHTLWAAVSRAVRTPSRVEEDSLVLFSPVPPLGLAALKGDSDIKSEELLAFEIGGRVRPVDRLSLDLAGFYNVYENLREFELGTASGAPPAVIFPLHFDNKMRGEAYGVEASANVKLLEWWMVSGGFTFIQIQIHDDSTTAADTERTTEGGSPHHQFHVRSNVTLPWNLEFDVLLWYVDHLPGFDIPSYVRLDARLGWRPTKSIEAAVGVQNVLDDRHPEFGREIFENPSEAEHAVYGTITWRF